MVTANAAATPIYGGADKDAPVIGTGREGRGVQADRARRATSGASSSTGGRGSSPRPRRPKGDGAPRRRKVAWAPPWQVSPPRLDVKAGAPAGRHGDDPLCRRRRRTSTRSPTCSCSSRTGRRRSIAARCSTARTARRRTAGDAGVRRRHPAVAGRQRGDGGGARVDAGAVAADAGRRAARAARRAGDARQAAAPIEPGKTAPRRRRRSSSASSSSARPSERQPPLAPIERSAISTGTGFREVDSPSEPSIGYRPAHRCAAASRPTTCAHSALRPSAASSWLRTAPGLRGPVRQFEFDAAVSERVPAVARSNRTCWSANEDD